MAPPRSLLLAALVGTGLAPVVDATASSGEEEQQHATLEQVLTKVAGETAGLQRIVVEVERGADVASIAWAHGLALLGVMPDGEAALFGADPTWSADVVELLLEELEEHPDVHDAGRDEPALPPEVGTCTKAEVEVSGICVIGFVDHDAGPDDVDAYAELWAANLGLPAAQSLPRIDETRVAVLDTGIDPSHPAFAKTLVLEGWDYVQGEAGGWDVPDGLDEDGDGLVDEAYGHGTHVASTILAVDPEAQILPMRVLTAEGSGWAYDVACAVWDAHKQGADVINLSISVPGGSPTLERTIRNVLKKGTAVVTSAGNTAAPFAYFPGTWPTGGKLHPGVEKEFPHGIVSVGAVDAWDAVAPFSAWGGDLDVVAPGVGIHAALPGGAWGWWSGTSMATAVFSGSASLVHGVTGAGPEATCALVKTAVAVDAANPDLGGLLGNGRIDVIAAIESLVD